MIQIVKLETIKKSKSSKLENKEIIKQIKEKYPIELETAKLKNLSLDELQKLLNEANAFQEKYKNYKPEESKEYNQYN